MLESKNAGTLERGRKAQQKYEDKYGISLSDDVREYRGRDRKTGTLVNAKVGKEAAENKKPSAEAYALAGETGIAKSATGEAVKAKTLNLKTPKLPTNVSAQKLTTENKRALDGANGSAEENSDSAETTTPEPVSTKTSRPEAPKPPTPPKKATPANNVSDKKLAAALETKKTGNSDSAKLLASSEAMKTLLEKMITILEDLRNSTDAVALRI